MNENKVYMIMVDGELREVTQSEFAELMGISPEGMQAWVDKQDYIADKKENENYGRNE